MFGRESCEAVGREMVVLVELVEVDEDEDVGEDADGRAVRGPP